MCSHMWLRPYFCLVPFVAMSVLHLYLLTFGLTFMFHSSLLGHPPQVKQPKKPLVGKEEILTKLEVGYYRN